MPHFLTSREFVARARLSRPSSWLLTLICRRMTLQPFNDW
jgi:hypothetical protein